MQCIPWHGLPWRGLTPGRERAAATWPPDRLVPLEPHAQPKIVVCGAGVIGCSVAYHLSLRDAPCTLIDRSGVAPAASGKVVPAFVGPLLDMFSHLSVAMPSRLAAFWRWTGTIRVPWALCPGSPFKCIRSHSCARLFVSLLSPPLFMLRNHFEELSPPLFMLRNHFGEWTNAGLTSPPATCPSLSPGTRGEAASRQLSSPYM